ncbi:MAG: hypothetical protein GY795_33845 [Desulfobacterales bacterium]|nr:hypothetical protein [Desulfobacterales bacterium]
MNNRSDNQEHVLDKMKKKNFLLQKKLKRSEINRARLEVHKEKSYYLLKTINSEIEQARKIIEEKKHELGKLYEELKQEKHKSEELLLNILPAHIAEELKQKGKVEPVLFESATVLFTDFKGFTKIAAEISPQELVKELDFCFSGFDLIIEKYGLERLKTIGDAYMCVCGISSDQPRHSIQAVQAAVEIAEFMNRQIQKKRENNTPYWDIRIGIHTGPVVAGVVGEKKFAYDIWGDTVNIASRMESASEAGKINISKDTYELVKEHFTFEYRGKIAIKNRGEIEMYFIKDHQT